MRTHDVAIVGAGPAGSSLAIQLADRGLDVLLIEKAAFPRDKTCGDLISTRALQSLEELGCREALDDGRFIPLRQSHVVLNGEWLNRDWTPYAPDTNDHAYTVPRMVLDEILFRKAEEAGVSSMERTKVLDIDINADGVQIVAKTNAKTCRLSARMVVGADGANSVVARSTGMAMSDRRYIEYAMRAYCHGLPIRETVAFFEEKYFPGYGWVFPISDEYSNIGVGLQAETAKKFGIGLHEFYAHFVSRLEDWAAERGWRIEIEKAVGFPIKTYGGAGSNVFDRGLLIGEAGCLVDPLNGEGIPLALESASLAADTISEAFATGQFDRGHLSTYEQMSRKHFDKDMKIADLLVSMIRNRYLLRTWIESIRLICRTAESDPEYAWKVGGVLAGSVPISDLLGPEILIKSVSHGPRFWMDFYRSNTNGGISGLLRNSLDFSLQGLFAVGEISQDIEWLTQWSREITRKQMDVAQIWMARSP